MPSQTTTKRCRTCGELKIVDGFNRNRRNRDGRQDWCRTCQKAHHIANREALLARMAVSHKEEAAAYRAAHLPEAAARAATQRRRHSRRHKARYAVNNAIRDGRLHPDREGCVAPVRLSGREDIDFFA